MCVYVGVVVVRKDFGFSLFENELFRTYVKTQLGEICHQDVALEITYIRENPLLRIER